MTVTLSLSAGIVRETRKISLPLRRRPSKVVSARGVGAASEVTFGPLTMIQHPAPQSRASNPVMGIGDLLLKAGQRLVNWSSIDNTNLLRGSI